MTGVNIAVAVMRGFGATAATLTSEEVEAGIPIGTFADGPTTGMSLITETGASASERPSLIA